MQFDPNKTPPRTELPLSKTPPLPEDRQESSIPVSIPSPGQASIDIKNRQGKPLDPTQKPSDTAEKVRDAAEEAHLVVQRRKASEPDYVAQALALKPKEGYDFILKILTQYSSKTGALIDAIKLNKWKSDEKIIIKFMIFLKMMHQNKMNLNLMETITNIKTLVSNDISIMNSLSYDFNLNRFSGPEFGGLALEKPELLIEILNGAKSAFKMYGSDEYDDFEKLFIHDAKHHPELMEGYSKLTAGYTNLTYLLRFLNPREENRNLAIFLCGKDRSFCKMLVDKIASSKKGEVDDFLRNLSKDPKYNTGIQEYSKEAKLRQNMLGLDFDKVFTDPTITPKRKFEIACELASYKPYQVYRYIDQFDENQRFDIIKTAIEHTKNASDLLDDEGTFLFTKYNLSKEHEIQITERILKGIDLSYKLTIILFRNFSEPQKYEIAKNISQSSISLNFLGEFRDPQFTELLSTIILKNPKAFEDPSWENIGGFLKIDSSKRFEIATLMANHGNIKLLTKFLKRSAVSNDEFMQLYESVLKNAKSTAEQLADFSEVIDREKKFFPELANKMISGLASTLNLDDLARVMPQLKSLIDQIKAVEKDVSEDTKLWVIEIALSITKIPEKFTTEIGSALIPIYPFYSKDRTELTDFVFKNQIWNRPQVIIRESGEKFFEKAIGMVLTDIFDPEFNNVKEELSQITTLLRHSSVKNFKNYMPILRGLLAINNSYGFNSEYRRNLVTLLISGDQTGDNIKKIVSNFSLIPILINLEREKELMQLVDAKSTDLTHLFEKILKDDIGITDVIPNLKERYFETFGHPNARNPVAALVYAGKLKQSGNNEALDAFRKFMEAVLKDGKFDENGDFVSEAYSKLRYENNPHLDKVFKNNPDIKKVWMLGAKYDLEDYMSEAPMNKKAKESEIPEDKDFKFLKGQVHHMDLVKYPHLKPLSDFLNGKNNEEIRKSSLEILSKSEDSSQKHLQIALIRLFDENSVEQRIKIFEEKIKVLLRAVFPMDDQFKADLLTLGHQLNQPAQITTSLKGFTIEDTDNPYDFLLCGTEVDGSCQNISGSPELNKCLMGYALDGKIRLIVVKDAQGKIVARRIMRLLYDPIFKSPVLYQECLYKTNRMTPEMEQAMDRLFIERAKVLGIPLVQDTRGEDHETLRIYPNLIRSYGNPAPFEYVDTKKEDGHPIGVVDRGKYVLSAESLSVVYVPPKINWKSAVAATQRRR